MKVIIIGGMAGGMSAAAKLKRNLKDNVTITVYEKGPVLSVGACGIPFYVSGMIEDADALVERTPEEFRTAGIDVKMHHEAVSVDRANKTVTVRNHETNETFDDNYDKLIVASGARVRRIPPFNDSWENLHVVRSLEDAVGLRKDLENPDVKNVIVTGAGFIGLEIAESCSKKGKNVLVVEFANRILATMDPEITDHLGAELTKNGVQFRTDAKVTKLDCDGTRILEVVVESGEGEEKIPADLVVNCAGIVPNAEFIDVKKAVNGAIIVNERMETSDPDVYAAGDCSIMTSYITDEHQYAPLGTNANKQGKIIAQLLSEKSVQHLKLLGSSALRLFSLDAAKVGLSEIDAQRLNLDYKVNRITGNSFASYYSPEKVMVKLVYDARSRKLLGAQTLGHGIVVPRANYFAIAIAANMTVDEFGYIDLCYSPPFSGVWDTALIAATSAK